MQAVLVVRNHFELDATQRLGMMGPSFSWVPFAMWPCTAEH